MNLNNQGIQGFDVSFYQDNDNTPIGIDFKRMKEWGADFVIIRAGQNSWPDSDFKTNWQAAKEAGIPRGAYWFYDPRVEPKRQAKIFADLVGTDAPEGRLWIDLEYPTSWGGRYIGWQDWRTMLEELKLLTGYRIGVYTANWWWSQQYIGDYAYFGQYPLWVAQYVNDPMYVTLPKGWTSCVLWQNGTPTIGHQVGVESEEIDHNYFNGGAAEFQMEFGATIVLPPEEPKMIKGNVIANVNIRTAPGGDATGKFLKPGDVIEADKNSLQWLHLTRINGEVMNDQNLWASAGVTQQYIKWSVLPTEPPVTPPPSTGVVKHTILVRDDGKISVDGQPYV